MTTYNVNVETIYKVSVVQFKIWVKFVLKVVLVKYIQRTEEQIIMDKYLSAIILFIN